MLEQSYDYIIVGSGTAGSLLANRLSRDENCKILLVEAGGADRGFWLKLPVGYFKTIYNARVSHLYRSQPGAEIGGRQIDCPRGRVLGGSSSINGLIFIRGQREDFDDWAALGATGWGSDDVLPYFRKFERYDGAASFYRGYDGELSVARLRNKNAQCDAWLKAAEASGLPRNSDFNGESSYGIGSYQLTLDGRWRASAATAFLHPVLKRSNLSLLTNALVARVLTENGVATGVEVIHQGEKKTIRASTEVIVCAGTIQSPQILQLSGIGAADKLSALGIPVVQDAPEVGENLQDHIQTRIIVELTGRGSLNDDVRHPFKLAEMGMEWLFKASGPLTVGAGQVGGATCTPYAENGRPDLQLFVMPLSVDKPGMPLHKYSGFTTSFWQCHPESRGSVHIHSTDPTVDPIIQTNYFSAEKDRKVAVEGLKIVREIYNRPEFKPLWSKEIIPGAQYQSDAELLEAVRKNCTTVYHLSGTCRMGSDERAVVDPTLRVNGVDRLRVVDASVMPKITAANTNAPTYMIAEKGADLIRRAVR